jgi:hypothetical protein
MCAVRGRALDFRSRSSLAGQGQPEFQWIPESELDGHFDGPFRLNCDLGPGFDGSGTPVVILDSSRGPPAVRIHFHGVLEVGRSSHDDPVRIETFHRSLGAMGILDEGMRLSALDGL